MSRLLSRAYSRYICTPIFDNVKESAGIPESILVNNQETCIRIPMNPEIRSLNLSNSAAIVLYEALRQNNFVGMETEGQLRNYDWK